jgi:nitrite reductase/ring-hydroxylating ferredoxin subunit
MTIQDGERVTVPPDGGLDKPQPRWRRDFPIDWPQDEYVSRRDFTRFMILTSLAFTVGQFWILLQNRWRRAQGALPIIAIGPAEAIPVGGSQFFTYPSESDPCVLVRLGENAFVAFDRLCTHLLCPVFPEPEEGHLHCPCHEGYFDIVTGRPLAGPPQRPLARITLENRNGTLYATGKSLPLSS